jgi:hypothetical protein
MTRTTPYRAMMMPGTVMRTCPMAMHSQVLNWQYSWNLVFLWPSWLDGTGAGGLMPQFVMKPTIQTHCFLRWGQTPVLTLESGQWLRTGRLLPLDTNKLETPSGDCRCRGLLLQDTQSLDVRGSFYWTPMGWAHPQVATTFGGSFHWTLGHLTYLFVSGTSHCTISGPRHRSTNQLGRAVFRQCELCRLLGLSLAQQTFLATRKLGFLVAKLVG